MSSSHKFGIPADAFTVPAKKKPAAPEVQEVAVEEPVQQEEMEQRQKKSYASKRKVSQDHRYRFNLSLSPETAEYVRREAIVRGYTINSFLNMIIDEYKADINNKHYVD